MERECMDRIHMAQDSDQCFVIFNVEMNLQGKFLSR